MICHARGRWLNERIANGSITELTGIDPRNFTGYSPYWVNDVTLNKNNGLTSSNVNDGLTIKSNSIGLEGSFKLANGWKLEERFRRSSNSGRFISIFPADNVATVGAGTTYATGPNAGRPYAGQAFTATVFNTSLDDLGATTNDLKVSKAFNQADGSKLTTTAGLFTNTQRVALTWNFNQYLMQATDTNPALLNNAATAAYGTTPGMLAQGSDVWGGCCTRVIDATYRTTSPYLVLAWEKGAWSLDGSLRSDRQVASGTYNQATAQKFNAATTQFINYKAKHTSYSFGLNYQLNVDTALFARVSDGVAFNADRIAWNGSQPLNGAAPIPLNEVTQYEGGVKWRRGNLSTFVTLFEAKTKEGNYDATTQKSTSRKYSARGLELESGYRLGAFRLAGGLTFTSAKITESLTPAEVGLTPNRQAKLIYQLSPSYSAGNFNVGLNIVGTTKSKDSQLTPNEATLKAYTVVNANASYYVDANTTATLGIYNLTNALGYTESNDGRAAARSINGRSIRAGLKYSF